MMMDQVMENGGGSPVCAAVCAGIQIAVRA
jgi:hypothetical protein